MSPRKASNVIVGLIATICLALAGLGIGSPPAEAAFYPCGQTGMHHVKTKTKDSVKLTLYAKGSGSSIKVCATAYKVKSKTKSHKLSLKGVKTSSTTSKTYVQRLDTVPSGVGLKFTATHTNDTVSYTVWND